MSITFLLKRTTARAGALGTVVIIILVFAACDPPYPNPVSSNQPGLVRILSGHTLWVDTVAWSPDGKFIASGGSDDTGRIWDPATGKLITMLNGIQGSVLDVEWSPDSKYLATATAEVTDTVRIWDAATWQVVAKWKPKIIGVSSVSWSPDGERLAVGIDGLFEGQLTHGVVAVYTPNGQLTASLTYPDSVSGVKWSPNGKYIAFDTTYFAGGKGIANLYHNRILMWEVAKGDGASTAQNTTTLIDTSLAGGGMSWSPNGQLLAVVGSDYTVKLLDIATRQSTSTLTGPTTNLSGIAWSPDGKRIAANSYMTTYVWDIASGQKIATFRHPDFVNDVSWAPDSKLLATASSDHNVRIWEVK